MAKEHNDADWEGLEFIADKGLRMTIGSAIQYSYLLSERAKEEKDEDFKTETYRVIILYVASIIEAILLYVYKKKSRPLLIIDYRHVQPLNESIQHSAVSEGKVVVAVQMKREALERELTLDRLVTHFQKEKLMSEITATEIVRIKDVRNTFHLSKSRDGIACDIAATENAFKQLLHVVEHTPVVLGI